MHQEKNQIDLAQLFHYQPIKIFHVKNQPEVLGKITPLHFPVVMWYAPGTKWGNMHN